MRAGAPQRDFIERTWMAIMFVPSQFSGKIIIFVKCLSWVSHLYFPTSANSPHISLTTASPPKSCLLTDKFSSSLQSSKRLVSSPVSPPEQNNRRLYKSSFWDVQGSFFLSFISVSTLNCDNEAKKGQANVLKYIFLLLYYICMCWNYTTFIIVPNEV